MRLALALLGLALPTALQAQAANPDGVWRGTIGNLPVHACFGRGNAYYYDRVLQPIRLAEAGGAGGFAEEQTYDKPSGARWQIESVAGDALRGRWTDGKRTLPIALTRMEWDEGDYASGACSSPDFMAPRMAGGTIARAAGEIGGIAVQTLRYIPPAAFRDDSVVIESFSLAESEPGDAEINDALALYLPQGTPQDDFAQCLSGNLGNMGMDGDFQQIVHPESVTSRWLGVIESSSNYCGGAHPNHWQARRVFDRQSGAQVPMSDWLNERGLASEAIASDDETSVTITPALRQLIVSRWPSEPAAEYGEETCAQAASTQDYWNIGLAASGLAFIPSFPHVLTACAETIVVPWNDLNPFLTDAGKEAAASLEGNP